MSAQVFMSRQNLEHVSTHARSAYPEECCGLLIGPPPKADTWQVSRVIASENATQGDPRKTFEIDPTLLIRTQRELRETGEEIIGYYHSHPDGPPRPSAVDEQSVLEDHKLCLIAGYAHETREVSFGSFITYPAPCGFAFVTSELKTQP